MKIAKSIDYAATPEKVFAVLSDVKFQEAKCAATAAIKHSADVKTVGDHTVITTERILPSDGLPEFAKSMVGASLKVTETQDWGPASADGSRSGTVEMAVAGAPIVLTGTLAIAPGGPGTVQRLDADLKAKVPIIGGKIEKAASPPIEEAIDIEARTVKQWLAR